MADSSYIFESGEAISVGEHGDHAYVFASGQPVEDGGISQYVFESGTGLGGGVFVVEGTVVGAFETTETHEQFYDYTKVSPNAQGLKGFGIDDQTNTHTSYVFLHHDTTNDTYALGTWHYGEVSGQGEVRTDYTGLGGHLHADNSATNPIVTDSESEGGDVFGQNGAGDPYTRHGYGIPAGDGVMYQIAQPTTVTVDIEMSNTNHPNVNGSPPDEYRGRGPTNNVTKTAGAGSTLQVLINVE